MSPVAWTAIAAMSIFILGSWIDQKATTAGLAVALQADSKRMDILEHQIADHHASAGHAAALEQIHSIQTELTRTMDAVDRLETVVTDLRISCCTSYMPKKKLSLLSDWEERR